MLRGCVIIKIVVAVVAYTATERTDQEYAMVTSHKSCRGEDATSPYCRTLAKATNSSVMGTTFAATLYDEYHKRGAGGLLHGSTPRAEQQRLATFVKQRFPVLSHPCIGEGGPGSCWVLKQLKDANYSVHGQELSRFAQASHCVGLDVRLGPLKDLHFADQEFDVFIASHVIEHVPLPDLQATLKAILRVTRGYFVFTVGVCAKWCQGYCSSPAIHPTGLCDTFPRQWWEAQLQHAGFAMATKQDMHFLEHVLFPNRKRQKCNPDRRGSESLMWCMSDWNAFAHNYFMARRPDGSQKR